MGRVFKAKHRIMNRLVAVKILSPELFRSAGARARFRREAEAAARLTHPHVVAAYDAGEADGRDFLVMEFVEGQNLSDKITRDGPLPVRAALAYVAQAARGLAYAHAAGVVHRDVKPANLLLNKGGVVKVLDMGLARMPSDEAAAEPSLTAAGAVMGTASYMAPEQATDTHRADERLRRLQPRLLPLFLAHGSAAIRRPPVFVCAVRAPRTADPESPQGAAGLSGGGGRAVPRHGRQAAGGPAGVHDGGAGAAGGAVARQAVPPRAMALVRRRRRPGGGRPRRPGVSPHRWGGRRAAETARRRAASRGGSRRSAAGRIPRPSGRSD